MLLKFKSNCFILLIGGEVKVFRLKKQVILVLKF
jgi:hypothetical protein